MILSLNFCWFVVSGARGICCSSAANINTAMEPVLFQWRWAWRRVTRAVVQHATKTEPRWLALLLSVRFWKASVPACVASATQTATDRKSAWLRSSRESNDSSFVTRMTTPCTLLQPGSSALLLCASHISAFFFFFPPGTLQRMRGEYQCCL